MKNLLTALVISTLTGVFGQNNFLSQFEKLQHEQKIQLTIPFKDTLGNHSTLPIVLMKGAEDGPVFTFIAGVHGFELSPIIAVQKLLQQIELKKLSGTLVVLPISSPGSFYNRSPYKNPEDNTNLNGAFPGKITGTITSQIAHFITTKIIPVTDVFLDIHSGDAPEDLIPFVCYYNNQRLKENTARAKKLSEVSGFQYIVSYPYTITNDEPAKYAFKQAVQDGKIALSIESGKLGIVETDAVELTQRAVLNMLHEMKMYPEHTSPHPNRIYLNRQLYTKATKQGLFYSSLKAGDQVKKGEKIGYTTNAFGEIIEEHEAPQSGIVLYMLATPAVNQQDTVACVSASITN